MTETAGSRGPPSWGTVVLSVYCAGVGAWYLTLGRHVVGPDTVDGYLGQSVVVTGTVEAASQPPTFGPPVTATFRVRCDHLVSEQEDRAVRGMVMVSSRTGALVAPGERVALRGTLNPTPRVGRDGSEDYADRLARQDVLARMTSPEVTLLRGAQPSIETAASTIRNDLAVSLRSSMPEPEATLLLGEVAGVRGSVPPELDTALVNSGLVHILAISGIKVAIVIGLLAASARMVLGRTGSLIALGGVVAYTLIGGATASALRSSAMGSLALLGRVIRRDTDVLRSLLLAAALMLTLRPSLIADLSFQYSFLGVLGIHLYAAPIAARLSLVPHLVREALAVTAGAQLGTLPLTGIYFHVVPVVSPLANALVLPLLPVAMVSAALTAVLQFAPILSVPAAALAFWTARFTLVVATVTAAIPGAAIHVPWMHLSDGLAYYAGLATATGARALGLRRLTGYALAAVVGLGALLVAGMPDGKTHIRFLAGTSGPAVLVTAHDGATMLIDGGSSAQKLAGALDSALPLSRPLPGLPRHLDAIAITGSSNEEAGAFVAAVRYRPSDVFIPASGANAVADGAAAVERAGGRVVEILAGDVFRWHALDLEINDTGIDGRLAIVVTEGPLRGLMVDSVDAKNPPQLPTGDFVFAALGSGSADPISQATFDHIVLQPASNRRPGRALSQHFGRRLWDVATEGSIELVCDLKTCHW